MIAAPGRTVYLAGQTALNPSGELVGASLPDQFDLALANLVTALAEAGGGPADVVTMQIFVTDLSAYQHNRAELGRIYRQHFGRHYPAMALLEVKGLLDGAQVEVMGTAVIPAE